MLALFLQTLPFFALIGTGYGAAKTGLFPTSAAATLTRFVFYFALSALLFRLGATLPFEDLWRPEFLLAYLSATGLLYVIVLVLSRLSGQSLSEAAFEAQCSVIGNTGFIGLPMFVAMFGAEAGAVMMMVLTVDLVVFGTSVVALVQADRGGGGLSGAVRALTGVVKNPMVVSIALGIAVSATGLTLWRPVDDFTRILGSAATPAALFAIGCTLAAQSADRRRGRAVGLSALKLVLHPALVYIAVFHVFEIERFVACIAVAGAALPVAGNIYILAEHFGVAQARVSAAILISTVISVASVTLVLSLLPL